MQTLQTTYFSKLTLLDHSKQVNLFFRGMDKTLTDVERVQINQRRYLGCKTSVLDLIDHIVQKKIKTYNSFIDIFAGTGVVGYYFNKPGTRIVANDILVSNYRSLTAWLSPESYDESKIIEIISEFNELKCIQDDYVSKHFGNKYFSMDNARKIGAIREKIENYQLSGKEKAVLLTSLLYAIDRAANTCGHYDAYRQNMDTRTPVKLLLPHINNSANAKNEVYNEDGNSLIRRLKGDILYIDPPYNSRQYCDTYHVLDNIMIWAKPPVFGKAKKYDRTAFKSKYNTKEVTDQFDDLIMNANVKHILFSYNNMKNKGNSRSNSLLSDKEILKILRKRGVVEVFQKKYNQFTAGKSDIQDHTERVFYCKVSK